MWDEESCDCPIPFFDRFLAHVHHWLDKIEGPVIWGHDLIPDRFAIRACNAYEWVFFGMCPNCERKRRQEWDDARWWDGGE